jgi:hypothetical protein
VSCAAAATAELVSASSKRIISLAPFDVRAVGRAAQQLLSSGAVECAAREATRRRTSMLETIAIILIVLWLLGMVSGYTMGNFIYVLLVIAIVLFLVRLISGRRV